MSRRCMPSEWPRQTVTAVVATNSASAPQVKVSGPPTRAATVMAEIHSDLAGFQRTLPSTASVSSASSMRGDAERAVGPAQGLVDGVDAVSRVAALAEVIRSYPFAPAGDLVHPRCEVALARSIVAVIGCREVTQCAPLIVIRSGITPDRFLWLCPANSRRPYELSGTIWIVRGNKAAALLGSFRQRANSLPATFFNACSVVACSVVACSVVRCEKGLIDIAYFFGFVLPNHGPPHWL